MALSCPNCAFPNCPMEASLTFLWCGWNQETGFLQPLISFSHFWWSRSFFLLKKSINRPGLFQRLLPEFVKWEVGGPRRRWLDPLSLTFQPEWTSTRSRPSWCRLSMTPWAILMDLCKKNPSNKRGFSWLSWFCRAGLLSVPWFWMSPPSQWWGPAVLCRDGGSDSWERFVCSAPSASWQK